jgi:hypothetical protein
VSVLVDAPRVVGRRRLLPVALVLAGVLLVLAIGYVYGVLELWDEWQERPVRLSYFLSDLTLVLPAGCAALFGVWRRKRWGVPLLTFVVGAVVFDVLHQVYYLFSDNYFRVPKPLLALALLGAGAYGFCTLRAVVTREGRGEDQA